jgi:hypothetical protein
MVAGSTRPRSRQSIFRRHGEAFRQAHAGHLGGVERRIMGAITACRTAVLGGHVEQCDDCGATRIAYKSCRNRHCPKCQGLARAQWLAERQAELLPVPYFHVVFTLPASVGEIAFQNKDTWGHVHCVVPGGGPSLDGTRWVACRPGFFLPVRVLSRLFRRLFLRGLENAFGAGKLRFFGKLANLAEPQAFTRHLGELRRLDWGSTPSPRSAAPSRCWPISAAIPIALPSPTAGCPHLPTAKSASPGKTTGRAARPR